MLFSFPIFLFIEKKGENNMSDIRFRPVRGRESIIKDQAVVDGNIYFATDSGKIFIDA
jgi:hypothetical protein